MTDVLSAGIDESRRTGTGGTPALVCKPRGSGTFPCVMILHERYGLVPHTENLARELAATGLCVVAPDLFYTHPDQAALHAGTVGAKPTDPEVLALMEDAYGIFSQVEGADPSRFGLIGVCQTGRYPILWGAFHPIRAAITLYGAAQDSDWAITERFPHGMEGLIAKLGRGTKVLGIFGEGDHVISIPNVLNFRNVLEKYDVPYQVTVYPSVPHGWLNDTMPGRYRPDAARKTWDEVIAFLHATLYGEQDDSTIGWTFRSVKSRDYDFTKNVRFE